MGRHIVTNDPRSFQHLTRELSAEGIHIDHFHAVAHVGGQEQRYHLNKQRDGSFQPKCGAAPSQRIGDYVSVIADEWHHR